jgi:hypothetical protein
VRLTVQLLDVGTWPPEVREETSHAIPLDGPSVTLDALDGMGATLSSEELVVAWREQFDTGASQCGPVAGPSWRAKSWRGRPGNLAGATVGVEGGGANARGVSVTSGTLGAAVFVAVADVVAAAACAPGDPNCVPAQCSVSETVTVLQGGETTALSTVEHAGGTGLLSSLSSGTAFGRAVAVMLQSDGKVRLAAPALGPLPAVEAEYAPPADVPVQLVAGSDPILVATGRDAWLGALMGAPQFDPLMRGVAVVLAGCGQAGTGVVLGWPPPVPDAGVVADAGEPDASAGLPDGGFPDAG